MSDTSEFIPVVAEFMQMWGTTANVIKITTTGEYDPNTSSVPTTETVYPVTILPFDYINKFQGLGSQDSTLILTGDKQVFIQPTVDLQSINPTIDKIEFGGVRYSFVTVKEMNPTLNNLLYFEAFVRR